MDIFKAIRELAKSVKHQNLFCASKEVNGINLFKNRIDFTFLQEQFLTYLYNYDSIYQEISSKKIDKKIIDNDLYCDCYLKFRREKGYEIENKEEDKKPLNLKAGNKIIFPKRQ